MANLLRLVACLFVLLSFNAKALVINGCIVEPYTSCNHADLSNANLSYANLSYADLTFANLSNANLSGAKLIDTDLSSAQLIGADLSNADLLAARLDHANLTGAFYNHQTYFDPYIDPIAEGMIFVSEVPLPAGIYLFLSGIVGLGLMRVRNG